jgi:hypothetical protein
VRVKRPVTYCAVCVDRPSDRMDVLEPGGIEYPMCSVCATHEVRDPATQAYERAVAANRNRARARHRRLVAAGLCINGPGHDKPIQGTRCEECRKRDGGRRRRT